MACKSIDDCTSASCNNLPSAKSPIENRTEISETPVENTPKESNTKPKNAIHGSYHKISLRKDSCIDIIRKNQTKIQKYKTTNSPQGKNEEKQKKVRDRENTPETIRTKPSDIDVDVTNRVYIIGDRIVNRIRGYELSQRVENCKVFVKNFSGAKVRCMEDYIQPALRKHLVMLYSMSVQMA